MTRILVTAEAFGFGPPSKLHAICVELAKRGIDSHYAGHGTSLTFARSNYQAYTSITPVAEMTELASIRPDGFDAALSVMDPFLALWAGFHGLPSVYVDSLHWFWRWPPEDTADFERTAMKLLSAQNAAEALEGLATVPMHASQYIAHHLSTKACAQRSPGTAGRINGMPNLRDVEVVEAIVDLSHRKRNRPDFWLATASGMLNPLVPADLAVRWLRIAAELITEAAEASGSDEPLTLAGNPEVLTEATSIAPERLQLIPMDHANMLQSLNGAVACLAPPGLTTVLECAAYGTPLIFLPEQHYGHLTNYLQISRCGNASAFPHALVNAELTRKVEADILTETRAILNDLDRYFCERGAAWSRMVSAMADGMMRARHDRQRLRTAQGNAVRDFAGGYSGAIQVANVVESLLS